MIWPGIKGTDSITTQCGLNLVVFCYIVAQTVYYKKIHSRDFYEEVTRMPVSVVKEFEFSIYLNYHYLYSLKNKWLVFKCKDKFAGDFCT